ncbi:beta-N-acetylhexosaminidase [Jiangella sp. DSM 45060]|uniref:beta-N-acetylhexosaminidase n=1 Tax=Jiangella sp. DSM 45060 TaxID=1798224 RepID=UPI00087AE40E|nr:beta-N-acetylhexosaminidase [Jiangella sp. DSM 45060]SDS71555.1 hexosaminidase [Jiangella sp. DSM 45060]
MPSLIPLPLVHEARPGAFTVDDDTAIGADGDARRAAWLLHDVLTGAGVRAPVVPAADPVATIVLRLGDTVRDSPEGYRLTVTPERVTIDGGTAAALARAVQTFRQLLPAAALRRAPVAAGPVEVGCGEIEDAPRFEWRGVHLDVARHFQPVGFVLKLIDLAALHRLNVVHLHLTDDQGWRVEVPAHPRLTEAGSWRTETAIGRRTGTYDGTPHGGFFTLDDLREIVAYADARAVTVVPEIDLPGHVQAVLAAYPELGNTGQPVEVRHTWGISENVLAPTDEALAFARDVLDTVLDVFPGPWVHLGGDEVPRTEWRASAAAAARAAELGLASVDELQSWFLRRLHDHVTTRGRRVVGWDEVVDDGGMPADTVVMAWRGSDHGVKAMAAGHDVVMCPEDTTYFDHHQSDGVDEPLAIGGLTTVEDVAAWEPAGGDGPGRLLGVQGQLWTEYLPTPSAVEYAAFPRLSALAEVAWTAPERRDAADLLNRLPAHLERLDAAGVNYRPLDGPRPWQRGGTGRRQRTQRT